jgi:hypothetical protein
MFRRILRRSIVTLVVALPTAAAAQQTPAAVLKGNDTAVETAFDATLFAAPSQTNSRPQGRDSLLNGIVIGGFVGGLSVAVGTFAVEKSICSGCPVEANDVVTGAVVGAAIGSGIGAAVDALRDRHRSRATPGRGPFEVSPILARGRRGILAWVRF